MRPLIHALLTCLVVLLLAGCSGSDTYRGLWKATGAGGEKLEITFAAKSFTVKDAGGQTTSYTYTQNSVAVENASKTYGIRLGDGRALNIHFPVADDESRGVIQEKSGMPIYTISRNGYIQYADLYKL